VLLIESISENKYFCVWVLNSAPSNISSNGTSLFKHISGSLFAVFTAFSTSPNNLYAMQSRCIALYIVVWSFAFADNISPISTDSFKYLFFLGSLATLLSPNDSMPTTFVNASINCHIT
jgi:hypothetical protein